MHDDPLIYPGHDVRESKSQPSRSEISNNTPSFRDDTKQKGDLLISNL